MTKSKLMFDHVSKLILACSLDAGPGALGLRRSEAWDELRGMTFDLFSSTECRELLDLDRIFNEQPFEAGYALHRRLLEDDPIADDFRRFGFWLSMWGPDYDEEADSIRAQGEAFKSAHKSG